jgi:hypothetical protein
MGLDMYLYKVKRYGNATLKEIIETGNYVDWMKRPMDKYTDCTPEQWCGCDETYVRHDLIEEISKDYIKRYSAWDKEQEYGYETILQNVAYWRKANAIHKWFVEKVQDGIDNCEEYQVTKSQLEELLDRCIKVIKDSRVVNGKIYDGTSWSKEEGEVEHWIDGKVIADTSTAEALLPTASGFFFGSTGYDEWYLKDITDTIDQLIKILTETDFDNWIVYYHSSW